MASKNEAVVKFRADTEEFDSRIKTANSTLTTLRSELKLNQTQAKATGDSIDNLSDRARILTEEYEQQQSKIDALNNKLDVARGVFGEASVEVQKLETQLNNARTAQVRIQSEIDATNQALDEMRSSSDDAATGLSALEQEVSQQESELSRLKTQYNDVALEQGEMSDEARSLASQIQKTSSELQDNKTKLQQAESAADKFDVTLDDVGDTARDTGNDLDAMDVALGDFISDTAQNAISTLSGLEESTRDYRNEQNKLEAVAATSGQNLDSLRQGYENLYAITGDSTLASTAVLNMSAMGVSVEDQSVLVNAAAGAWAAYGDSIPLDGLLESINETTRAGTVTGSLADALNWANMSSEQWSAALSGNTAAQKAFNDGIAEGMSVEDAFNEALAACTTTQERQQLVTEAMDAAYGELGTTYQETNSDVIAANDATQQMTDAQAKLGEAISPVSSALTGALATGIGWLADNLPIVVPLVSGLAVGFTGLFIALQGATIIETVKNAMLGLNAAMSANPVGVVIALIAGLVTAFVMLWNNCEEFRNFWLTLWEGVQTAFQSFVDWISPIIESVGQWFVDMWNTISTGSSDIWTGVQEAWSSFVEWISTNIITPIVEFFTSLWTSIQEIWTNITNAVQVAILLLQEIFNAAIEILLIPWNFIWENFGTTLTNIWNTITSTVQTGIEFVSSIIQTVMSVVQTVWSTIWTAISTVASTIWNTISSVVSTVINTISSVISSVLGTISSVWSSIWGTISGVASTVWNTISSTVSSVIEGISSTISSVMNTISSVISSVWNTISSTISSVINTIKSVISTGFNAAKDTVSSIFTSIKDTISNIINGAADIVGNAIDTIKGFFNFSWSLPPLKLPHITISGSFSLSPPSVPSFGIEWYAKGGILEEPTVFGMNGSNAMVGGEAGPEAVAPIETLQQYMIDALEARYGDGGMGDLVDAIEALADRVISIEIDGRQLAMATASDSDRVSGSRQRLSRRGVSLS